MGLTYNAVRDRHKHMSILDRNKAQWLKIAAFFVVASPVIGQAPYATAQEMPQIQETTESSLAPVSTVETIGEGVADGEMFSFDSLSDYAAALALKPFQNKTNALPQWMADLDYDAYRQIRFKADRAIVLSEKVRLQLFHPGFLFKDPVRISLLSNGIVRTVSFDRSLFDYGEALEPIPEKADTEGASAFSGFRLHYPLNKAGIFDEVLAFQGASYFRFLGSGQQYGLSARGLALDTASAKGEEFPRFSAFWIEEGQEKDEPIRIYALLESPSITGAYRFDLNPGDASYIDVEARLFARNVGKKIGIAPLTSMFLYGENRGGHYDDYRPEVHDSDGLLIHNGAGEWLWRPLSNPRRLGVNAYRDDNPRGFGLFQRDADFNHYRDLEAHYHHRPSYWVEPKGDWGKGHVELVEIPSPDETNDNIVAFWVADEAMEMGERRDFQYRLSALDPGISPHHLGRASLSLDSRAHVPGTRDNSPANMRRHIVEFSGEIIEYALQFIDNVKTELSADNGEVILVAVQGNAETRAIRVIFDALPAGTNPMDIRLFLKLDDRPITEVWTRTQSGTP